jgi:hypothetical protein
MSAVLVFSFLPYFLAYCRNPILFSPLATRHSPLFLSYFFTFCIPLAVNRGPKLARGEGIKGTLAAGEFGTGQAAFAVEPAEEILRAPLPFLRIAFQAGGDKVAVGIAPQLRTRHDVIEAPHRGCEPAQTVKAEPALPRVDGLPQRLGLHKIDLLEAGCVRHSRLPAVPGLPVR